MGIATKIGEQVNALRDEFVKATSNDTPGADDIERALKLDADLKILEKQYADAQGLEQAGEARREAAEKMRAEADLKASASSTVNRPPFASGARSEPMDETLEAFAPFPGMSKSLSDYFVRSDYAKALVKQGWPSGDVRFEVPLKREVKAAGDPITTANFQRIISEDQGIAHPIPEGVVYDLITKVPASASAIRFLTATMPITGDAAPVAEAALKPEVQLRWAPVTQPLETIAEWTAVTIQALADFPALRQLIDTDLRNILMNKVDDQLLNGTGATPQILGIMNTPGVATQAFVTDIPTTIITAITTIITSGNGTPTAILMNAVDWQGVRTSVNAQGVFLWGPPTDQGVMRMWGVPVYAVPRLAAGFAIVGDFRFATIFQSMGVTFIVGWKNDDIIRNLQTIVCEIRLMLALRRPAAFIKADTAA